MTRSPTHEGNPMATSAAGREYRTQDVGDERYWTCETCGALVGPRKRN
jgi:hypothetical protein